MNTKLIIEISTILKYLYNLAIFNVIINSLLILKKMQIIYKKKPKTKD